MNGRSQSNRYDATTQTMIRWMDVRDIGLFVVTVAAAIWWILG
jgi:hypothetical protein